MNNAFLLTLIENKLDALIPEQRCAYQKLFTAARYALLGGGKRMRPLLLVATVTMLKGDLDKALACACAVEMVHTYSMIHDDLPCMDDDDFRRNKPSLHRAFPEAHAVLAGDFLLTLAFETIATDPLLSEKEKTALIALLARKSGSQGMIAGQIMDIEAEGLSVGLETLEIIHSYKTGRLITAAIEMGGIIAGAQSSEMAALTYYGDCIGLAFQIVDDVLDVTNSEQKHGKKQSSDSINNKTTYATLLGIDVARKKARDLIDCAKGALQQLPYESSPLIDIANAILVY